jgi:hypothetical protein
VSDRRHWTTKNEEDIVLRMDALREVGFFHTGLHSPQTTVFLLIKFRRLCQTIGDLKTIPETTRP